MASKPYTVYLRLTDDVRADPFKAAGAHQRGSVITVVERFRPGGRLLQNPNVKVLHVVMDETDVQLLTASEAGFGFRDENGTALPRIRGARIPQRRALVLDIDSMPQSLRGFLTAHLTAVEQIDVEALRPYLKSSNAKAVP